MAYFYYGAAKPSCLNSLTYSQENIPSIVTDNPVSWKIKGPNFESIHAAEIFPYKDASHILPLYNKMQGECIALLTAYNVIK